MSKEANEVQTGFSSITSHCLLHSVDVLAPNGLHSVLPASGSHKIESFCSELQNLVTLKQPRKKALQPTPDALVPTLDIHRFYSGATSIEDFARLLEEKLLDAAEQVSLDVNSLHRLCWSYYQTERRSEITYPKWLTEECTFRLFLIFNCILEPTPSVELGSKTLNEVLRRLLELTGYTWNDTYCYRKSGAVRFPTFVELVTDCFERLRLESSLTCEVIEDLKDEIVNGVLKKGYLTKKGHRVRNYKRRWFVLQRTTMSYYISRENLTLKGDLVLNGRTEVESLRDKPPRRYRFVVTCGHTHTPFVICADDQKMKHEWMLAIRKAIALARLIEREVEADDISDSLSGFYLLKYGTHEPKLSRMDSNIKILRHHTTPRRFQKLTGAGLEERGEMNEVEKEEDDIREEKQLSKQASSTSKSSLSSDEEDKLDEYIDMLPGGGLESSGSSCDESGYLKMQPADESSYDDPSSFKSVSVFSDGSSTGFSPPPSAHAHSLTDGTPPPLPSRDPISPQAAPTPISPQAAPTLGDGYIKMQSAEKRYDLLVEAGVSTPPGVIPRPHSTSSVGTSEKTQLVYEVCDHSVRYTPSSGSELQGTYVGMPKKTRSVTDVGSGQLSPILGTSSDDEDITASLSDWLASRKKKLDTLERAKTESSHLAVPSSTGNEYLKIILPLATQPPVPPRKERSSTRPEGRSPSPTTPTEGLQRNASPPPTHDNGIPSIIVPRKSPAIERRSQCPIPGEESIPPPVSPRHSRVTRMSSSSETEKDSRQSQPRRMDREPVGMESRPEPVGESSDTPPLPPPRRSTMAVGAANPKVTLRRELDPSQPPPLPHRGKRLSTPPVSLDPRGFTYSTPYPLSPPPLPPR